MPRAARKRPGAARYDPRAASPHKHDTRLARHRHAGINRLPLEILEHILALVPWQRARAVCRTWATLRPAPNGAAMQAEAARALARMAWYAHEVAMSEVRAARHTIDTDFLAYCKQRFTLRYLQHAFGGAPPQNAAALRKALSGDFVFWVYADTERQEVVGLHMAGCHPYCPDVITTHIPIVFDKAIPRALTRATKKLGRLTTRDKQIVYVLYRLLPGYGLLPLFNCVPSLFGDCACDDIRKCTHPPAGQYCPVQSE